MQTYTAGHMAAAEHYREAAASLDERGSEQAALVLWLRAITAQIDAHPPIRSLLKGHS
mgnify:CR=1 FL=1